MSFLTPLAGLLGLGALVVLAVHILKPIRTDTMVSSTMLWEKIARPVSSAKPWQRLVLSMLLLAQLLVMCLLVAAALRPVIERTGELSEHTIFVVDASGSMTASEGDPDRLALAVERAKELRGDVPDGGTASVIAAGADTETLLTQAPDVGAFERALESIRATDGSADMAEAATEASALVGDGASVVLLSDGGLTPAEARQFPPGTRWETVGEGDTNRAVSRLSVAPRDGGLVARAAVQHTGGPEVTQTVRIDVDGVTRHEEELILGDGDVVNIDASVPLGRRIEAFLDGDDLRDADDRARAAVPQRRELSVTLVGPPNLFIESALGSIEGVTVQRVDSAPASDSGVDLLVFDGIDPPEDFTAPMLVVAAPSGARGIEVTGEVEQPVLNLVRSTHPVLVDLDVTELGVGSAQVVDPGVAEVLLAAPDAPLLLLDAGGSIAYVPFALDESNLPLLGAFPVLVDRLVDALAQGTEPGVTIEVGEPVPVPGTEEVTVVFPDGRTQMVPPGTSGPDAPTPGFYEVRGAAEGTGFVTTLVAVDAAGGEADLTVAESLELPAAEAGAAGDAGKVLYLLVSWLAGAALVGLVVEWLLHRRRVGVDRTQWHFARGVRVVIAVLLLAALVAPGIDRPVDEVATVVVADWSDSLGAVGRADSIDFLDEALEEKGDGDEAGVIVVGASARVEQVVSDDPLGGAPSVVIDTTETDLAAGLRLAAASLPGDFRKRIVLVSDGRPTRGEVQVEIDRLVEDGVPVDVVPVGGRAGDDVAVGGLDVPGLARIGESVPITATLTSGGETTAQVRLRRNGEVIEEREVDLVAGPNEVAFVDPEATESGINRYQVEVRAAGDSLAANDSVNAAVPVDGPARILIAEGAPGDGDALVAALQAGGVDADLIGARALPPLAELSAYTAIGLVDVDRDALTDDQVEDLDAAVRDLGRGLVVLAGTRSFGLGGYLDSDLEELLPVISEVKDTERRLDIAQVLAIDTSESMGACHCADGEENGPNMMINPEGGGVNKTEIAREASARAIAALSENDEVGVLSVGSQSRWALDLQQVPGDAVVEEALATLRPVGETRLQGILDNAGDALEGSDASLRHVILFTDGFTQPNVLDRLAEDAAELRLKGITVSVIGTGEGSAEELRSIAEAGGGRFYAGRDLEQIPEILTEETQIASRDIVVEGEFLPEVVSSSPVVAGLVASPPLLGYQALTPRPTSQVLLQMGPDQDPLLTTWRTGLGKVTAWASDGGVRWAKEWTSWDGSADHWSAVFRDVLPVGDDRGVVTARVSGDEMEISVESTEEDWPDGAQAEARVVTADGERVTVDLERESGGRFVGRVAAGSVGVNTVGAEVSTGGGPVYNGRAFATRGYGAEYEPAEIDVAALERWSTETEGRGVIEAGTVFDRDSLEPGSRSFDLTPWLILAAALLWPLAVVLGLMPLGRGRMKAAIAAGRADEGSQGRQRTWEGLSRSARTPSASEPPPATPASAAGAQMPGAPMPGTPSGSHADSTAVASSHPPVAPDRGGASASRAAAPVSPRSAGDGGRRSAAGWGPTGSPPIQGSPSSGAEPGVGNVPTAGAPGARGSAPTGAQPTGSPAGSPPTTPPPTRKTGSDLGSDPVPTTGDDDELGGDTVSELLRRRRQARGR